MIEEIKEIFSEYKIDSIKNVFDYKITSYRDEGKRNYLYLKSIKNKKLDLKDTLIKLIVDVYNKKLHLYEYCPFYLVVYKEDVSLLLDFSLANDIYLKNDFNLKMNIGDDNDTSYNMIKNLIKNNAVLVDKNDLSIFYDIKKTIDYYDKNDKIVINRFNYINVYEDFLYFLGNKVDFNKFIRNNETFSQFANRIYKDFLLNTLDEKIYESIKDEYYKFREQFDFNEVDSFIENKEIKRFLFRSVDGIFYTPLPIVKLSYEYIKNTIENLHEHIIYDCAAGAGNLLTYFENKENIYASTLYDYEVEVMKSKVDAGLLNMKKENIFQFDFINDEFKPISMGGKIPDRLYEYLSDENKRRKVIFFINPPFVSHAIRKLNTFKKKNIYIKNHIKDKDLSYQFIKKIINNFKNSYLCLFLNSSFYYRKDFNFMNVKFINGYVIKSELFENTLKTDFLIFFSIYDTKYKQEGDLIRFDYIDKNKITDFYVDLKLLSEDKRIIRYIKEKNINKSVSDYFFYLRIDNSKIIRKRSSCNRSYILNSGGEILKDIRYKKNICNFMQVNKNNIDYYSVIFCILNYIEFYENCDRYVLKYISDEYKNDKEFITTCIFLMIYNLNNLKTHDKNNILTFRSEDVNAKCEFKNDSFLEFLNDNNLPVFNKETKEFYDVVLDIFRYYYTFEDAICNASFREVYYYFKNKNDDNFKKLYDDYKKHKKILADYINKKIREYKFI